MNRDNKISKRFQNEIYKWWAQARQPEIDHLVNGTEPGLMESIWTKIKKGGSELAADVADATYGQIGSDPDARREAIYKAELKRAKGDKVISPSPWVRMKESGEY